MTSEPNLTFKIIMIGGKGVGKASVVRRFVDHKSLNDSLSTIGIDCKTKTLNIKNQKIILKIWKSGQIINFQTLTYQFVEGADVLSIRI